MWDFVRHSDIGLPSLIDYLNRWRAQPRGICRARSRCATRTCAPSRREELRRITALMGETFSDQEIAQAVEFGAFDNLRALESKGFFRQGGLRRRNPGDPESFKVRRAKVGGYRDYFTPEQAAELERAGRRAPVAGLRLRARGAADPRGYRGLRLAAAAAARAARGRADADALGGASASRPRRATSARKPAADLAAARRQARRQRPGRGDRAGAGLALRGPPPADARPLRDRQALGPGLAPPHRPRALRSSRPRPGRIW